MDLGPNELVILAISGTIMGAVGMVLASVRGHSNGTGFWLGFFLGPIGWLLTLLMTPKPGARTPALSTPAPTIPAPPSAPAGWMADPTGRHEHRYWDGSRWTEHVNTGGQASTDQP